MNNASPSRKSPALPFAFCARALGVVLLLGCSLASSFAASSFIGLGSLPGGIGSIALAVSGDGKVVVGSSDTGSTNFEAFRWTAEGGMVGLGYLPGGRKDSAAYGVSGDGNVVVGQSDTGSGGRAFRWTAARGMVSLGILPGVASNITAGSYAFAVSGDGNVIVGESSSGSGQAQGFRWTESGGMVGLGFLGGAASPATGVSTDGSVIVGSSQTDSGNEAFRWTAKTGMVGLGLLPGAHQTSAHAVSGDGKVIVGESYSSSGVHAFRWTVDGGMVGLGTVPNGTNCFPRAVSGDGTVVVGAPEPFQVENVFAWIWDRVHGMRNLQLVLTNDYHLDLTGWKLKDAMGISADGMTIVGNGKHNGHDEAWIAHLDRPVNAPAGKERGK